MADEIQVSASIYVSNGGASISSGTISATLDQSGTDMSSGTKDIDYSGDEELALLADVAVSGVHLAVKNLDDTNYVELSFDTGGNFAGYKFAKIQPGGLFCGQIALPTSKTKIYAQANTAAVKIQFWAVEA